MPSNQTLIPYLQSWFIGQAQIIVCHLNITAINDFPVLRNNPLSRRCSAKKRGRNKHTAAICSTKQLKTKECKLIITIAREAIQLIRVAVLYPYGLQPSIKNQLTKSHYYVYHNCDYMSICWMKTKQWN